MQFRIGCRRVQSVLLPPVPAPCRHSNVRTTQKFFLVIVFPGANLRKPAIDLGVSSTEEN